MKLTTSVKWMQSLLFVASILFGLLISPLLSHLLGPLIATDYRALLAGLILLSVITLVGVHAAIAIFEQHSRTNQRLVRRITEISDSIGLRGQFIHEGNLAIGQDSYSIVREMMEGAEEEILILDHRPAAVSDKYYDQRKSKIHSRRNYYNLMTSRATSMTKSG
ncbi:MAG: hypothetical protein ISR88_12485, partial [Candidatus Marinimicrobia bacterium]|nr:hypothetical protein [Candidatus Neomarinimicrobiota bacterium]